MYIPEHAKDASAANDDSDESELVNENAPFEGPEKLLEIWFSPEPLAEGDESLRGGLRKVPREVWEEMLEIVKCKVLSAIQGKEMDAYLLSESSLFIFPHKLILKTCGTTLNLLGLPRILSIAREHCNYTTVYRVFYSRKSFMFPERQLGPHREWKEEVEYLDKLFDNGSAYTIGRVNGSHWLLYMTSPPESAEDEGERAEEKPAEPTLELRSPPSPTPQDCTIEILMSKLSSLSRRPFFYPSSLPTSTSHASTLSSSLGINTLFPSSLTALDSHLFEPCGYSANALVDWGGGEGYYTIHVTPEEGWSYASFECNVPIVPSPSHTSSSVAVNGDSTDDNTHTSPKERIPDLETLIQRVVQIFQPGDLTVTLFVSSSDEVPLAETPIIESAQRAFKQALGPGGYKRTDKINYEFGGYDLAFASFEKRKKSGASVRVALENGK